MSDISREEKHPSGVDKPESTVEDRQLIEATLADSKEAYGKLVLKYQKRLFRFVFMMLGKKDATEDVVQDAFVKGYLALGSFDAERPFYPWIATIARNLAVNFMKKDAREKPASEMEDYISSVPDKALTPDDEMIVRENDKRFARAVQSLPEQFRTVFVMRMIEKMSYDEIARELKISPGTVDSRLFRARKKMMELLKDYL